MIASAEPDNISAKIPVVIISGPTGSGKSPLAIALAHQIKGEVISADSRQIFRQLKIGTARLDETEWQGIPHHLTGMVDLDQRFTAFDFAQQAQAIAKHIDAQNKRAIVCGGTGLYLRAVVDGIFEIPDEDMTYRQELIDLAAREGSVSLHRMLTEVDPEEAAQTHPHNTIRVIRALEIFRLTGRPKSAWKELTDVAERPFRFLHLILMPDRMLLYQALDQRVNRMIALGLVDEARAVYESRYKEALCRCKVVGYAELIDHFEGRHTLEDAASLIMQNTRRFAKRQCTWFRPIKHAKVMPCFGTEALDICFLAASHFLDGLDDD